MLPVTAFHAGLLGFGFLYLSLRVVQQRHAYRLALGTQHRLVERAVRAHGNFAEYVPLALVMMALAEANGLPDWALHVLGVVLLAGRAAHAYGISREPEEMKWRSIGMGLTFTMLGAASAALIGLAAAGL
jgi:uncharacterized membrane protein YecN with MAPEG domain